MNFNKFSALRECACKQQCFYSDVSHELSLTTLHVSHELSLTSLHVSHMNGFGVMDIGGAGLSVPADSEPECQELGRKSIRDHTLSGRSPLSRSACVVSWVGWSAAMEPWLGGAQ